MIEILLQEIKDFTKLPASKQIIYLLLAVSSIFGGIAWYAWKINEKQHLDILNEKTTRLDTCENKNIIFLNQIEYWKDSLYSEKVKNLNEELQQMKGLSDNVKSIEKNIIKTNNNIKNKQHKIIKSLEHEK